MSLDKYATAGEKKVVTELVRLLLEAGHELTVFDGEEYTLRHSTNRDAILAALATTEEDQLFTDAMSFELLYGNAEDGSEVITDYAADDLTEADGFFNKAYEVLL